MSHCVFVYGTLKRGFRNHHLLAAPVGRVEFVGEARTIDPFVLLVLTQLGSPFLLDGETSARLGGRIVGEVFSVDDAVLASLDELEGHPHYYTRQPTRVELLSVPTSVATAALDATSLACWCYRLPAERFHASLFQFVKPERPLTNYTLALQERTYVPIAQRPANFRELIVATLRGEASALLSVRCIDDDAFDGNTNKHHTYDDKVPPIAVASALRMATATATPVSSTSLDEFCLCLCKVELHAHLNGSVRDSTVLELYSALQREQPALATFTLPSPDHRTLAECFRLFDVIHAVTTTEAALRRIVHEVVEDYAAENTIYLELRTTPKHCATSGLTKRRYVEVVVDALAAATAALPPSRALTARLLLSVNRQESLEEANATVALASEFRARGVVGVDLCGNPAVGSFAALRPAFERARSLGLKVTLHCGELTGRDVDDNDMLDFRPDRLGHVCCLSASAYSRLLNDAALRTIPLELCLTSNVCSRIVNALDVHPFRELHARGHPIALCTDDRGVFATTLSKEYALAAQTFGLTQQQLLLLSECALSGAFVSDMERRSFLEQLRSRSPK